MALLYKKHQKKRWYISFFIGFKKPVDIYIFIWYVAIGFKNNYNIKQDVINAIKSINKEMNEIAENYYKTKGLFK